MIDFVAKVQKDLKNLQKTLEKEGEDLIKKLKQLTSQRNIDATKKQVQTLVENKLKKFEPAMRTLYKQVLSNAQKAGIDVKNLEKSLSSAAKTASALKTKVEKTAGKKVNKAVETIRKSKVAKKAGIKSASGVKKTVSAKKRTASPARKKAPSQKTKAKTNAE